MSKTYYLTIVTLLIMLTGCQDMEPKPTVVPTADIQTEIDKPRSGHDLIVVESTDLNSIKQELLQQKQDNQQLNNRLDLLQQQYDELQLKVNQLSTIPHPNDESISSYEHALRLYKLKQYDQVILSLQSYKSTAGAEDNASKVLWLKIQAHHQLQHCESVITLVKQFNNRFPKDSDLPNAWILMADCQSKMQQNDIARESLRFIIRAYPDSIAAQKAKKQLDRK